MGRIMKGFLKAALERADAERLARLDERAREEARIVPAKPRWHTVAKEQRARGMSIGAIARFHGVGHMTASHVFSGKRR